MGFNILKTTRWDRPGAQEVSAHGLVTTAPRQTGDGWAGLDQEYPSLGSLPQSMEDARIPTSGTTKLITSLWQSTDWPTCRNSPLKLPFPWRNLLHARIAMKSADHKESGAWSREYGRHFPCSSEHYEKVTRVWSLSLMTISFIHISIQTYFPSILRLLSTYFQASFHFSARIGFLLEIPMSHLLRRCKTGFKPVYVKKLKLFSNGCSLPFFPMGRLDGKHRCQHNECIGKILIHFQIWR